MSKILKAFLGIVLIIIIVILFFFANRYSYIDTIEISLKENGKTVTVEPYRYDVNKIRRYYMFTNTFINHSEVDIEFECIYRVRINDTDEICYDEGKYALYTKNYESLDDIKEAVSNKELKVKKSKKNSKIIIMNQKFAKLLKEL